MARSSEAVRATGRIIVGLFSYEVFALATGTVPTLTELCRRYRWVEATILAVWLTHVHRKIVEQAVEEAAAN